jgi:ribulose-phosphate 3-epimerase
MTKSENRIIQITKMTNQKIKISPSILSADFAKLGEELTNISKAGADYIHIDVMDGSFVPNITIGNEVVKALRPFSALPFDVHLMINNPDNHVKAFAEAGADIITIHAEASTHLDRSISLIKSFGKKAGVSIVPSTNEDVLDYILDKVDLILVMTVNPGFGGQKFLNSQLKKITNIRNKVTQSGRNIDLQVDGGINPETAKLVIEAGADVLVSGSYIFKSGNYQEAISKLK